MSFFNELKRRNVIRVAIGYVVTAWLLIQVAGEILPPFGVGDDVLRLIIIAFSVGFIPVVVVAWVFEWTPQGIKVDEGDAPRGPANLAMAKRWDRIVMVILAVAVVFFIVENLLDEDFEIEPVIVVLPFEGANLGPESEYLPDVIAEGIYTSLARIPQLVVSARPTVIRLASDGLGPDEIVEKLNAANFMKGSVEVSDGQLELTVSIVETESGRTIWQDSFEGTTAQLFEFQYEIVAAAAENLQLGATGVLYKPPEVDAEASRLTWQAWSALLRSASSNRSQMSAGIELLERALAIDPDYPTALLMLATTKWFLALAQGMSEEEAREIYRDIEERVYAIDPENGLLNAYAAWGIFWDEGHAGHADHHLQVALRTGLNDPEVLRILAGFARRTGNSDAAVWFGERAVAIDPTCENCIWQTTENLFYARRYEEAIEGKKQYQAFGSGGYANHAYMLVMIGEWAEALELVDEAGPRQVVAAPIRAMAYHSLGDAERFAANVAELEKMEGWRAQSLLAGVYAYIGDIDRAFEALEASIELDGRLQRNLFLPHWDNLRDDPRWTALRERLGMSEEKIAMLDFSPVLQYER